ncbi:MAG: transglutaminase family protein [Acidobacteria bacterium]|nr:transglutaminase family protein [Acidobacteriota bacterium]
MFVSVEHSTNYAYSFPVYLEPHFIRLQPRMTSTQRLLAWDLQIDPLPTGKTECLDQDGTLSSFVWFDGPTSYLNVISRFQVELLRANPFDFFVPAESLSLPLWYPDSLSSALAAYRTDGHVAQPVKDFAHSVAADASWNSLAFLEALTQRIFHTTHHIHRQEGPPWPSHQTLQNREGSCRDLTVLFCDACRVMGIAARFVSGYECAAAGRYDSYMHAWAEVYLPSAGWRGYDPSRGLLVANSHVAVAAGADYTLAAPIAGLYSGGASSYLQAAVRMELSGATINS